jgi:hypothetical protein
MRRWVVREFGRKSVRATALFVSAKAIPGTPWHAERL